MLRELLSIFRSDNPLRAMGENFTDMLRQAYELTVSAGEIYFGEAASPEDRTTVYRRDVEINKLQRVIRKQVIAHLSLTGNTPDLPYGLALMSVVKDVERVGDYAKNLSEVSELRPGSLPEDASVAELQEIRAGVQSMFDETAAVFTTSDRDRAVPLIEHGRDLARRCDALVRRIAKSDYDAGTATALILGTRYYKRICAHVLNVLSSVVMPLHKLDYYDETELEQVDGDG